MAPTWLGDHIDELRERVSKIQAKNWQSRCIARHGRDRVWLPTGPGADCRHRGQPARRFEVLDSTHPDAVRRVLRPKKTGEHPLL